MVPSIGRVRESLVGVQFSTENESNFQMKRVLFPISDDEKQRLIDNAQVAEYNDVAFAGQYRIWSLREYQRSAPERVSD